MRLKVWDAYRPMAGQRRMWGRLPDTDFVADPATGSNLNRGAAQAFTDCPDVSEEARENRALLHNAMIRAGFRPIPTERWHFDDAEAGAYSLADLPL
ncbi:MAG: hypothetical protein IT210_24510 [Armatimonadetes bacterium]|nr:hypothetical protein [Armatimonadota bacterium]